MMTENSIERKIEELERASEAIKEDMEVELSKTRTMAEQVLKQALLVGGGFAVSYFLVKKLFSSGKSSRTVYEKEAKSRPKTIGSSLKERFFSEVSHQVSLFLLDLIREKTMDYLKQKKDHE